MNGKAKSLKSTQRLDINSKGMSSTNYSIISPKHQKVDENSLIPMTAYQYNPTPDEQVEYNTENPLKTLRKIFEGRISYLPHEIYKLNEFNEFVVENPIPEFISDANALRILQGTEYDVIQTYARIMENKKLNEKLFPNPEPNMNNISTILSLGCFYFHGRDNRFRPNLIVRPKILLNNIKKYQFQQWVEAIVYLLDYCIFNMLLPGRVENWNIICDMDGVSLFKTHNDVKSLILFLQNNYKCRLYIFYILNLSSLGSILWKLIESTGNTTIEKKLTIIECYDDLFKIINRTQIEKKYKGFAENINKYFPPAIISNDYFVDDDDSNKILMKSEDFSKLYPEIGPSEAFEFKNGNYMYGNDLYLTKVMSRKVKSYSKHNRGDIVVFDKKEEWKCKCDDKCIIY
jgi:hypothetical protein